MNIFMKPESILQMMDFTMDQKLVLGPESQMGAYSTIEVIVLLGYNIAYWIHPTTQRIHVARIFDDGLNNDIANRAVFKNADQYDPVRLLDHMVQKIPGISKPRKGILSFLDKAETVRLKLKTVEGTAFSKRAAIPYEKIGNAKHVRFIVIDTLTGDAQYRSLMTESPRFELSIDGPREREYAVIVSSPVSAGMINISAPNLVLFYI